MEETNGIFGGINEEYFDKMRSKKPLVSIIYVYFNTPDELNESITTIKQSIGKIPYEIIIVDNNSSQKIPARLYNNTDITVKRNKTNRGYGAALNQGVKISKGEFVLCVNPDVNFSKNALFTLVEKIQSDKDIGVIGPQMRTPEKTILQTASKYPLFPKNIVLYTFLSKIPFFNKLSRSYHYDPSRNYSNVKAIGGACMMFRKKVLDEIGGFDERFFLYFEEADVCKRIHHAGYNVTFLKNARVTHHVGKSLEDKSKIRTYFERSRFLFVEKHQGKIAAYISESIIRYLSITNLILIGIVSLSLFLNIYKITTEMMFIGDFARDMLVARDMILLGNIPLVGIPSSVVWLHQGPLSIYFIALSFLIGGFNPWVPSIFFGVMGAFSSLFVYFLGRTLVNKYVGLLSAILYTTSPLVIINHRIPYHTAPISFFTALFLLALYLFLKTRRTVYLVCTGLLLGFLFQLELSNGVLFFLVAILFIIERVRFVKKQILSFFLSFGVGILPFILHDLTHRFIQTGGFAAWVLNRIGSFFGVSVSGYTTTSSLPTAFEIVSDNIVRFVFPSSSYVSYIVVFIALITVVAFFNRHKYQWSIRFLVISLFVPILGFLVHTRPGSAYFPVIFPQIAILIGFLVYILITRIRMTLVLFLIFVVSNIAFTINHQFFLDIGTQKGAYVNDWNYGLGPSLMEQEQMVRFLAEEKEENTVNLRAGGFLREFTTSLDNYRYLLLLENVQFVSDGVVYTVYQDKSEVLSSETVVYSSENIFVTKHD